MNTKIFRTNDLSRNDLFKALKQYDTWSFLAWHDIKLKYRRSKVGPFWITLSMAVFCVSLGVVYSKLFKTEVEELLPFLTLGVVAWGFLSSCIGEMPNLFVDNASYMKDMRINPFMILLRAITRNVIIFGHNLIIVIGIYIFFGMVPNWHTLLVIPGFLLVLLNIAAIGMPIAIVGARYRDISQITQSVLQVIFFITPIFWFPRLLSNDSLILLLNPMAYYIDLVRAPLLGRSPNTLSWMVSLCTLLVSYLITLFIYRHKQGRITFWL